MFDSVVFVAFKDQREEEEKDREKRRREQVKEK